MVTSAPLRPRPAPAQASSAGPPRRHVGTVSVDDLRRNRIPLYLQIAEIFRRRIVDGEWPVKAQIPPLDRLVEEFGVARVTVRQALGLLEQEGLIVRYRAKGSFVLKRPGSEHWLSLRTDLPSLDGTLRNAQTRFLESRPADRPPPLEPDEGGPVERYQYLRREISRDKVIYAMVDVYLDQALYCRFDHRELESKGITGMLFSANGLGPFEGTQTLTIATADGEISALLDMPINAPIARVRRVLRDGTGRVVYLAHVVYRGEFVRLDIKLG